MTTSRVLGAATAVLLLATATATVTAPATADPPSRGDAIVVGGASAAAPVFRASWPVGRRTGTLTRHTATQTGAASQNFSSVSVVQRRAASTVGATVVLGAAPTTATQSKITVAFGRLSTDGGTCNSPAGNNFSFPSVDQDPDVDNPVYAGATITVKPFELDVAKDAAWNCAFAKATDLPADPDTPPAGITYDQVTRDSLREYIQKPMLSIVVKGRKLNPGTFTEVPIRISNSIRTIATAPDVRLSWKTTRVKVRALRNIGSIRPGTAKRSTFYIKRTERGPARVVFTATSRNYRVSVTIKLEPGAAS